MSNKHIRNMRCMLRVDYRRYLEYNNANLDNPPGFLKTIGLFLKSPGIVVVFIQRLDHLNHCLSRGRGVEAKLLKYYLKIVLIILHYVKLIIFKVEIHEALHLGPGFVICGRGKIIAGAKKIGKNFTLHHRVTIGVGGRSREKPTIGDNVVVESDTLIFGGIRIGNNVILKKGSVCSKNIPDNCIVGGNPARIIERKSI